MIARVDAVAEAISRIPNVLNELEKNTTSATLPNEIFTRISGILTLLTAPEVDAGFYQIGGVREALIENLKHRERVLKARTAQAETVIVTNQVPPVTADMNVPNANEPRIFGTAAAAMQVLARKALDNPEFSVGVITFGLLMDTSGRDTVVAFADALSTDGAKAVQAFAGQNALRLPGEGPVALFKISDELPDPEELKDLHALLSVEKQFRYIGVVTATEQTYTEVESAARAINEAAKTWTDEKENVLQRFSIIPVKTGAEADMARLTRELQNLANKQFAQMRRLNPDMQIGNRIIYFYVMDPDKVVNSELLPGTHLRSDARISRELAGTSDLMAYAFGRVDSDATALNRQYEEAVIRSDARSFWLNTQALSAVKQMLQSAIASMRALVSA